MSYSACGSRIICLKVDMERTYDCIAGTLVSQYSKDSGLIINLNDDDRLYSGPFFYFLS